VTTCPFCLDNSGQCWVVFILRVVKEYSKFREAGKTTSLVVGLPLEANPDAYNEEGEPGVGPEINFGVFDGDLRLTVWNQNCAVAEGVYRWRGDTQRLPTINKTQNEGLKSCEAEAILAAAMDAAIELSRWNLTPEIMASVYFEWS
jgi:hypothetical protein